MIDSSSQNQAEPVVLTRYADVLEVFRDARFATLIRDGTEAFRHGTMLRIEGDAHKTRRRTMGKLFRADGDRWFRERVLYPTVRRNVDAALAEGGGSGGSKVDLVNFAVLALTQLQCEIVGLHEIDSRPAAAEFVAFLEPIRRAMANSEYLTGDRDAIIAAGVDRKEEFRRRYWEPAVGKHRQLMSQIEQGEIPEQEMHHDLISMVVQAADPAWTDDPDLGLREALTDMLNAGLLSTADALVHAADHLLTWLSDHPEDRHLLTDPGFIAAATVESLRLRPVALRIYRDALEDVNLPSGAAVKRGDRVLLLTEPANRDTATFGQDADAYNPHREVPAGVYPFGVAFGSGRHMCYGFPLVMGNDAVNGALTQMLHGLMNAGMRSHPTESPQVEGDRRRHVFTHYPVLLG